MLDQFNLKLLAELQEDGRQGNRVLARKLRVSEGTIRKRIKDLRGSRIIRIAAVPNPRELGLGFICVMGFEVKLAELRQVSEQLSKCPNVYFLSHVTGHYDLVAILLFRAADELNDFVRETISVMPSIARTTTFVSMNIVKSPWEHPLDVAQLAKL